MLDEAIELAVNKLEELSKIPLKSTDSIEGVGGTGGDNARYGAVVIQDDEPVLMYNAHPCHAYMKQYKNPVILYNQYGRRKSLSDKIHRSYLDWIVSDDGPWRSFGNRSISHVDIFDYGWVWSDLSFPSNLQQSFLIASRMPAEWPILIKTWYEWVKDGVHPSTAFLFLNLFIPVKGDTKKYQICHLNKYDWPVDICTAGEDYTQNFLHGYVEKLNKPYSVSQDYKPVNRIFGVNTLASVDPKAYPNVLWEKYANKKEVSACEAYWKKSGLGFSTFEHSTHWFVDEDELISIMKKETKRLL